MKFELELRVDGKPMLKAEFTGQLREDEAIYALRFDGDLRFECDDVDTALFLLREFADLIEDVHIDEELKESIRWSVEEEVDAE